MAEADAVSEIIRLAFEAKKMQYRNDLSFHISPVGPLMWLHCVPGWFEVDAFYARDVLPSLAIAAVQACNPHRQHMMSVLADAVLPDGMTEEYASLGYVRLPEPPQPLMHLRLSGLLPNVPSYKIECRSTDEGRCRYAVMQEETAVSTAEVVWVDLDTIYIFEMRTLPERCRLGLATTLLSYIHAEACQKGATQSILWSSPLGLPLYSKRGYKTVVTQHGFVPCDAKQLL